MTAIPQLLPSARLEPGTVARYRLSLVREPGTPYERRFICTDPAIAARHAFALIGDADREVLGLFLLDAKHRAIGHHIAYVGTLSRLLVQPRGILVPALLSNATSVVLFHNHPSGDPTPSAEDVSFTRRVVDAGQLLEIDVLDHIVLGEDGRWVSLLQRHGLGSSDR